MCTHPAAFFSLASRRSGSGETRDGTLALAKPGGVGRKRDLSLRLSFRHDYLRDPRSFSRWRRHPADDSASAFSFGFAYRRRASGAHRLGAVGGGRGARHRADFCRHPEPPEAVAVRARRSLRGWLAVRHRFLVRCTRMDGGHRGAAGAALCGPCSGHHHDRRGSVVGSRNPIRKCPLHPWMAKAMARRENSSRAPRKPNITVTSRPNISCSRTLASGATPTFTSSGTARRIIFLPSTTSGIGKALRTCKASPGFAPLNVTPAPTIPRGSSAAYFISPSRKFSIAPKPRPALAA